MESEKTKTHWRWGERQKVAEAAGTTASRISRLLNALDVPSKEMAERIEAASVAVVGEEGRIPAESVMWPKRFPHPLVDASRE